MTREEAFVEINETQDDYINQLIQFMNEPANQAMKVINFTSPTGTGKTKMMAKLINRFPNAYFIVTSLSKGQLHLQIKKALSEDCSQGNFDVYGLMDYKINSLLTGDEILDRIPKGKRCIWLRDEGHIETNRFEELLTQVCHKVINFSATNKRSDIQCNFTHTMMLRTVNQQTGTPEDAINKLLSVKQAHCHITGYNPCAIFRCISHDPKIYKRIIRACKKHGLRYIDISEEDFNMEELCRDDNEYDVIINKYKLVEGIDIRRAHVLYMDSQPQNDRTTIQAIGRCRRNALLYRDDIDILASENRALLKATRECHVFYNVKEMAINQDENGELCYAFCPYISCEALKAGVFVEVENGQMSNGLYVQELRGKTGRFKIAKDEDTGFNVVNLETEFYQTKVHTPTPYFYVKEPSGKGQKAYKKIRLENVLKFPLTNVTLSNDGKRYRFSNDQLYSINNYNQWFSNFALDEPISAEIKTDFLFKIHNILDDKLSQMRMIPIRKYLETVTLPESLIEDMEIYIKAHPDTYNLISRQLYINLKTYRLLNSTAKRYLEYRSMKQYDEIETNQWKHIEFSQVYNDIAQIQQRALDSIEHLKLPKEDTEALMKVIDCCFRDRMPLVYTTPEEALGSLPPLYTYINMVYGQKSYLHKDIMEQYFDRVRQFRDCLHPVKVVCDETTDPNEIVNWIEQRFKRTYQNILNDKVDLASVDSSPLYEPITEQEWQELHNGRLRTTIKVRPDELVELIETCHGSVMNDRESAIIGLDKFQLQKSGNKTAEWTEMRAVTSKIKNYNKLNVFISKKYSQELQNAKEYLFTGKNEFSLDKRCNSMIGYCVEYYSKYMVYGEAYLEKYIRTVLSDIPDIKQYEQKQYFEMHREAVVIRACMLKYKAMITRSFGEKNKKVISTASITSLVKENYHDFVELVVSLGTKTAEFVKKELYADRPAQNCVDPNLSIDHIAALADYITEDTILDVKVTNHIEESYIKQVLAYHYLSTKRSDLHIKRVIVYDATSGKSVTVNITPENCAYNAYEEWQKSNPKIESQNENLNDERKLPAKPTIGNRKWRISDIFSKKNEPQS